MNREVEGVKENNIIHNFEKSSAVNSRVHGGTQKERSLKFEQEDEQSRGFNAVKQTDIILKSESLKLLGP